MAASRSDKSTISPKQDPLANVSYSQPPLSPPINGLIADTTNEAKPAVESVKRQEPKSPAPETEPAKGKVTVVLPQELIERLRNAAWWKRTTLAALSEEGIQQVLIRLERENGGTFKPRENELKPGRPQGSRSQTSKGR